MRVVEGARGLGSCGQVAETTGCNFPLFREENHLTAKWSASLHHRENMLRATVLGPSSAAAALSIPTIQVPTTSAALHGFAGTVSLCTPSASQELPGLMPSLPGAGIVSAPRCFLPPSWFRKPVSPKSSDLTLSRHYHQLGREPSPLTLSLSQQADGGGTLKFLSFPTPHPVLPVTSQNVDGSNSSDSFSWSPPYSLLSPHQVQQPQDFLLNFPWKKKKSNLSNLQS